MKFKLYLIFIAAGISVKSFSQDAGPSIVAAAGGVATTNTICLEWTLGEVATQSITSNTALYTQGYHQPILMLKKVQPVAETINLMEISVFPNPATSTINIQLGFMPKTDLSVSLLDMHGRLLLKKEIPANNRSLQLDVNSYAKGTYLLNISNAKGNIFQSYKVIKG